jgi:hypothetical protein
MARYSAKFAGTASTTIDLGYTIAAASNPRRFQWFDLMFGSSASPADNPFLFEVQKRTAAGTTPSAVTPQPLDDGDTIASTVVASNQPAVNGAGAGIKLSIPLNQRATFRWVAAPGSELTVPATASQGLALATPTGSAVVCNATILFNEL